MLPKVRPRLIPHANLLQFSICAQTGGFPPEEPLKNPALPLVTRLIMEIRYVKKDQTTGNSQVVAHRRDRSGCGDRKDASQTDNTNQMKDTRTQTRIS